MNRTFWGKKQKKPSNLVLQISKSAKKNRKVMKKP